MTGETDLDRLLSGLEPVLQAGLFRFATLPPGSYVPASVSPVMVFREAEGMTLVVSEADAAAAGLASGPAFRMLTLTVHSSLEAVGLIAAVSGCLATAGIPVNPVSGYYHDHLFVPADRAEEALALLWQLSGHSTT
jgi:hypothetical protein